MYVHPKTTAVAVQQQHHTHAATTYKTHTSEATESPTSPSFRAIRSWAAQLVVQEGHAHTVGGECDVVGVSQVVLQAAQVMRQRQQE